MVGGRGAGGLRLSLDVVLGVGVLLFASKRQEDLLKRGLRQLDVEAFLVRLDDAEELGNRL